MLKKNKAVFLDRDGVINKCFTLNGKPYPPKNLQNFEVFSFVGQALNILKQKGYLNIIVTNQPDPARGKQSKKIIDDMHNILIESSEIISQNILIIYHTATFS